MIGADSTHRTVTTGTATTTTAAPINRPTSAGSDA